MPHLCLQGTQGLFVRTSSGRFHCIAAEAMLSVHPDTAPSLDASARLGAASSALHQLQEVRHPVGRVCLAAASAGTGTAEAQLLACRGAAFARSPKRSPDLSGSGACASG